MKNRNSIYFLVLLLFNGLISIVSPSGVRNKISVKHFKFEIYPKKSKFSLLHFNTQKSISFQKESFSKLPNKELISNKKSKITYLSARAQSDSVKIHGEIKAVKKTFFGKVFSYGLPPAPGLGPCEVGVFKTYYFFGMRISGPKPVMTPLKKNEQILIQEVVPCGTEYKPAEKEKKDKSDKSEKKDTSDQSETPENLVKEKRKRKMDEQFFN